ncbi:MAG: hypothetical protein WC441_00395 [Patescibacteria group bacterium]
MLASSQSDKNISQTANDSKALPPQQRWAVILLSALGLSVIIFWAWQFKSRVSGPFQIPENKDKYAAIASSTDLTKDTDGDGLTDYEESSVYETSPYLADSDSDNINDGQEIKQGTNPNCPTGQTCGLEAIAPPSASSSNILGETTASETDVTLEEKLVNGDISPAELRQLLLDNGADQASLSQISDQDLLQFYQETLQSQMNASSSLPALSQ